MQYLSPTAIRSANTTAQSGASPSPAAGLLIAPELSPSPARVHNTEWSAAGSVVSELRKDVDWYRTRLTRVEDQLLVGMTQSPVHHNSATSGVGGESPTSGQSRAQQVDASAVRDVLQSNRDRVSTLEKRLRDLEDMALSGGTGTTAPPPDSFASPSPVRPLVASTGSPQKAELPFTTSGSDTGNITAMTDMPIDGTSCAAPEATFDSIANEFNSKALLEKYERLKEKYHRQREKHAKKEKLQIRRRVDTVSAMMAMVPTVQMAFVQPILCFPSLEARALVQGFRYFGHRQPISETYRELAGAFVDPVLCGHNVMFCVYGGPSQAANVSFVKELAGFFMTSITDSGSKRANLHQRVHIPFQGEPRERYVAKAGESDLLVDESLMLMDSNAVSLHFQSTEEGMSGCAGFTALTWLNEVEGGKENFLLTLREATRVRALHETDQPPPLNLPRGSWWRAMADWFSSSGTYVCFVGVASALSEEHSELNWMESVRSATHPLSR